MSERTIAARAGHDDGFTLVELLVAMVLSMIVLLATVQALDLFTGDAGKQVRVTDANERARATMDRLTDDLRGAATIRVANATDLVYSDATTTGSQTERLCVAGATLYRSVSTTSTTPGTACGSVGAGWSQAKVATLPNPTTTAFTYDGATSSATPSTVKTVGITLNLDATGGGRTASSTLRASATLRRVSGQLAVSDGDVVPTCNSGGALLTLGAGLSGLNIAKVTYASSGGIALGVGNATTPVQIPKGITTVVATITDAAGVTNTIQKTVECT